MPPPVRQLTTPPDRRSLPETNALLQFEPEKRSTIESVPRSSPPERRPSGGRVRLAAVLAIVLAISILVPVAVRLRAPRPSPVAPPPVPMNLVAEPAPIATPQHAESLGSSSKLANTPDVRTEVPVRKATIESPADAPRSSGRAASGARFYGSLVIDSSPVSARAFINGEAVGVTPLVLAELPVGSRALRLEADGHVSWSATVRVVAGQQTRVSATLSPSP